MGGTATGKIIVVHKGRQNPAPIRARKLALDTERVAAWMDALARTIEASRVRLPGDGDLVAFQAALETSLQSCLNDIGNIALVVEEFDLLFEGHCVYHNATECGSISATLYRDGVRRITLRRGVRSDELRHLVDILGRAIDGHGHGWDDAATLLWEGNLRNIDYACAPIDDWDPQTGDVLIGDAGAEHPVQGHAEEPPAAGGGYDANGLELERSDDWPMSAGAAPPRAEPNGAPYAFTSVEAENIRMITMIEDVVPLHERVLEVASAMLTAEQEAGGFLESGSIIALLVERAVGGGDMKEADQLVGRLRSLAAAKPSARMEFEAAADRIIEDIAQSDYLCRIGSVLTSEREIDLRALTNFLTKLGPAAAPTLCDVLGEVDEMKFRRAICEALAVSCRDHVDVLVERLSDPRWFLVRNILYILGRIGHQGVERAIGDALYHSDVRVRRESVRALGGLDSPTSRAYLNSALRDSDKGVRILVAKQLSRTENERGAKIIWSVIESPEFADRDGEERAAFFRAFGRAGSDALVPRVELVLTRPRPFPSGDDEIRAAAALSLAWLGTPAALAVLSREVRSRHDAVRRAVVSALETVGKLGPKR